MSKARGAWNLEVQLRHCIVCLRAIPGTHTMYCDEDRVRVRRATWRDSKRRGNALVRVRAIREIRLAIA